MDGVPAGCPWAHGRQWHLLPAAGPVCGAPGGVSVWAPDATECRGVWHPCLLCSYSSDLGRFKESCAFSFLLLSIRIQEVPV